MHLKIVHVAEPLAGGIVTFLKSLVDHMPDDVHILVHGERREVMRFEEVKKHFGNTPVRFIRWRSAQRSLHPEKDFRAFLELYTVLKRLKSKSLVDVVHLHSSKSGFIGRLACRVLGIENVIYTPNGAPFMVGATAASNYIYKQLERLAARFGGRVVCCSPSEQEAYQDAGIDAITINNGINTSALSLPAAWKRKGNTFRVITSGRILRQKNPALFNKIARYFKDLPQFEFVWAGDGADRHLLTSANIRISGWLSRDELQAMIKEADVFISTASFEGLPFGVLEALAMKKPVLLTDCTGNRDLVNRQLNGDLIKNENDAAVKLMQYFNNASMLRVMGEHSYDHCAVTFNAADTFRRYRALYAGGNGFNLNQLKTGFYNGKD